MNLGQSLSDGHRGPIAPVTDHRVKSVRDRDNPSEPRDLRSAKPTRITSTVPSLVMCMDDPGRLFQTFEADQELKTPVRVATHLLPLSLIQGRRLLENRIVHRKLADIMKDRGQMKKPGLDLGQAQLLGDPKRVLPHPPMMASRLDVFELNFLKERLNCLG